MEDAAPDGSLSSPSCSANKLVPKKVLYGQINPCLSRKEKYNVFYHGIPVCANSVLLGLKFASQVDCVAVEEQTSETCFAFDFSGCRKVMGADKF